MKVVILCGGQGSRLREHTEHIPKPMVGIGNKPILWHIMRHFSHYGYNEFVLCLGYKGIQIKEYFLTQGQPGDRHPEQTYSTQSVIVNNTAENYSWTVHLVDTGNEALTGARLKKVSHLLDGERFWLTYGDGVADIDLDKLLNQHLDHGLKGTVTGVHPPARFGELELEGSRVTSFSEKPQVKNSWINGGFFIFERSFLNYLTVADSCLLEGKPLEKLAGERQLNAYLHAGFWQCMDTYRDWKYLNSVWDSNFAPWRVWNGNVPV